MAPLLALLIWLPPPTDVSVCSGERHWEVAEAFIGSEFDYIARYKEFEVSPQSEWVNREIDREDPKAQQGMKWNSGLRSRHGSMRKRRSGMEKCVFRSRQSIRDRRLRAGNCESGCTGSPESFPRLTSLGAPRAR